MEKEKNNLESIDNEVTREALYGTLPVRKSERPYGFIDALLILSGYAIATWCYTQGAFMATYTSFPQLLTSVFGSQIFIVALYMLPMVLAARFGIDFWQWLKAVFGTKGVKIVLIVVILAVFPWFGVCADIFGNTMMNLFYSAGIELPVFFKPILGLLCVVLGSAIAILGPIAIKWANRIIVPLLLLVGVAVFFIAFTAVPMADVVAFRPDVSWVDPNTVPYICAVEAGLASGFSWCASSAVVPRICKDERSGYWATVGAYGFITPMFNLVGGVLAIAVCIKCGEMGTDISTMLMQLGAPGVALLALLLVIFANICTHGTGAYMYAVVLKTAFPKVKYSYLVIALGCYAALIVFWGQIIDYFGTFITLSTFLYAPMMSLLLVDFFFVRKGKVSLRGLFELEGHTCYKYSAGFNIVGFVSIICGVVSSLLVFDAVNYVANSWIFNFTTASLLGFIVGGGVYLILSKIPAIGSYLLKDREDVLAG